MTRVSMRLASAVCVAVPQATAAQATRPTAPPKPSYAQPGISPDGEEIAFVSAGDIWVVPSRGGEAHLPTHSPPRQRRAPALLAGRRPPRRHVESGRQMDIWILTFTTGHMARLTVDDGDEQLDAWSRDSEWICARAIRAVNPAPSPGLVG